MDNPIPSANEKKDNSQFPTLERQFEIHQKSKTATLFIFLIILTIGIVLYLCTPALASTFAENGYEENKYRDVYHAIAIGCIFMSISSLIYIYLSGGLLSSVSMKFESSPTNETIQSNQLHINYLDQFIKSTEQEILFEEAEQNHGKNNCNFRYIAFVHGEFCSSKQRLTNSINSTRRNANINLMIGIMLSGAAIYLLISTLINSSRTMSAAMQSKAIELNWYIPRVTLSIFIEIFSFFFLRLYRRNLEDVKYIGNEITNIEMKIVALTASIYSNSPEMTKGVIEELSKTERNFILKKDESTMELQKMRIESEGQTQLIDKIASILKK